MPSDMEIIYEIRKEIITTEGAKISFKRGTNGLKELADWSGLKYREII